MENWQGYLLGLVLAVLGYSLMRSIKQLDTTVNNLTNEVSELKGDRKAQQQLNEFLEKRIGTMETENTTLRRILNALDKIIYAKLGIDLNEL